MSGLLALFDDVAAIAKLASAQLDDMTSQAAKAGSKTAGVVIDDAAVTPKFVTGLPAAREIPIVAKIASGSLFNKLVILLPALMMFHVFAPWMIAPLLIVGGAYLCFEGAEKIWHAVTYHQDQGPQEAATLDAAHLEVRRVKGAIKTDFILSSEIMTIALASISNSNLWEMAGVLGVVAVMMTVLVYGAVALLVKIDDVGLRLSETSQVKVVRAFGRGLVTSMPMVLKVISIVGTAAMLWVGGSIVIHGLHEVGWHWPYNTITAIADAGSGSATSDTVGWLITAFCDAMVGLVLGLFLMPIVNVLLKPLALLFPEKNPNSSKT